MWADIVKCTTMEFKQFIKKQGFSKRDSRTPVVHKAKPGGLFVVVVIIISIFHWLVELNELKQFTNQI